MPIVFVSLLATGCWDASEVDQLAIVTASGLDLAHNDAKPPMLLGTVQIARVSQLGSGQSGGPTTPTGSTSAFVLEQGEGVDPVSTLEAIRRKLSRNMIMSHRQTIVLGEDLARAGVRPIMDEIVRNPESRLRTAVLIAYHSDAKEILSLPYALNRLPTEALSGLQRQGSITNQDARNFIKCLAAKGDPYAIGVEPSPTHSKEEPNNFNLQHIAVFQKDHLVGWLNGNEVSGFLWLTGQMKRQMTHISLPGVPGTVDATLLKTHTNTRVAVVSGHPQIQVTILLQDDLSGNSMPIDLGNPANINKVKAALESKVRDQSLETLKLLQTRYDADIAGFADKIYQRHPALWHQLAPHWRDEFKTLPVKVEVHSLIHRGGYIGSSVNVPVQGQ